MWGNELCSWGASFGHGHWLMGGIFPLLFLGILAYLVFSILKSFFSGKKNKEQDSAFEILRNRYASGEIDEREYNEKKVILTSK